MPAAPVRGGSVPAEAVVLAISRDLPSGLSQRLPRGLMNLGVRGRTAFAAIWLVLQATLVLTAHLRPDRIFAFRMFNESSTISIGLARKVRGPSGPVVVATNGNWQTTDRAGLQHWFHWTDRIEDPILGTLGRPVHAAYGVETQLDRLQAALDDVVHHTEEDTETLALLAIVEVKRNGHAPYVTHLESAHPPRDARDPGP